MGFSLVQRLDEEGYKAGLANIQLSMIYIFLI